MLGSDLGQRQAVIACPLDSPVLGPVRCWSVKSTHMGVLHLFNILIVKFQLFIIIIMIWDIPPKCYAVKELVFLESPYNSAWCMIA